jgi:hypothetical protein
VKSGRRATILPLANSAINGKLIGMTQAQPPKLYADVEAKLAEPLAALLTQRREQGMSWRRIAVELTARTGIDITGETLRIWHQGRAPVAAGSAA